MRPLAQFILLLSLLAPVPARADGWCGVDDSCDCGAGNPYPCCDNGNGKHSNCTWGAWHMACCNWGKALPSPWQHAKYWAGNYASHPDYDVVSSPVAGSIGCRTVGGYGHVAYVTGVNGGTVYVHEQSCCEGSSCWPNCSWCINAFQDASDPASYFDGGYIVTKGTVKVCGNGKCDGDENCGNCSQDCGSCCGNGKCDNGESCSSCSQDCGGCCGNGSCDNGENCQSCSQDCGGCCGNGACDYGEDCASCEKDCGICNDPPIGELEVANCQVISGWARDPDVDWPIAVRIMANGNLVAEVPADGPHPSHPGNGFSYSVDHALKDGQEFTIDAIGQDDKDLEDAALAASGRKLLCRNGLETLGIWQVEYHDAAGIEIRPTASQSSGWTALRVAHPGGLPYPTSGTVSAAALISKSPFAKISAASCGGFDHPLYSAQLHVEQESSWELGKTVQPCWPIEFEAAGTNVSANLGTSGMEYDSTERALALDELSFWSNGWRFGYSWDASGAIWSNEKLDTIVLGSRDGQTHCQGQILAARSFKETFTGLELMATPDKEERVPISISNESAKLADLATCLKSGKCSLSQIEGQELKIAYDCGTGLELPEGYSRTLYGMRVFRDFERTEHPWTIRGEQCWGLDAVLPNSMTPGLAFRVSTVESDFVPCGAVTGEFEIPAPGADEVRGMLSYSLPGQCFKAFLTMDGTPLKVLTFGDEKAPFSVEGPGKLFGVAITAGDGCGQNGPPAHVEVSNVSYKRQGWWTTPSPDFAGIRDSVGEGCSLEFENLKWWGMLERTARGSLVTHRFLESEYRGIRYRLSHTFDGPWFKFRLLLDGKPAQEYELHMPDETDELLEGESFHEVGFQFQVHVPDQYPYKWGILVEGIEVLHPDAGWVSICEAEEGEPDLEGVHEVIDADATGTPPDAEAGGSGPRSGACSQSAGDGQRPWMVLLALMLLGTAVVVVARSARGRLGRIVLSGDHT